MKHSYKSKKNLQRALQNPVKTEFELQEEREQERRRKARVKKQKLPKTVRHASRIAGWEDMWMEWVHIGTMILFLFSLYMAYELTIEQKNKEAWLSNLLDSEILKQIGWGLWIACGLIVAGLLLYAIHTFWFDHVWSKLEPEWQLKVRRNTDFDGGSALIHLILMIPMAAILIFALKGERDNAEVSFWGLVLAFGIGTVISVYWIYRKPDDSGKSNRETESDSDPKENPEDSESEEE